MTRSRTLTAGLVLAAVLGALDIVSLPASAGSDGPPLAVGLASAVFGVITLVGVRTAWKAAPSGLRLVVASRVLSAALGIPAFFVDEAGTVGKAFATVGIVLTAATVGLIARGRRQPLPASY